jgi:two-component system phosphate regulon sensor histidine kinase PhoR
MRKKLLTTYILIIAVTVIVTVIFSWTKVNRHLYDQVEETSELKIKLVEQIFEFEFKEPDFDIQDFAVEYGGKTDLRITIIDMEGVVLADSWSEPATMENHKYRAEFKEALKGNAEKSIRFSSTLGKYYFYFAIPINTEGFDGAMRISLPVESIESLVLDMISSILIGLIIGVVLSFGIAYTFTRRFVKPIDELTATAKLISSGDYDHKVYIDNNDQIGELADAFNTMTFTMRKNLWNIEAKNAELQAILVSMDTGLAAIDENYKIILCNDPFMDLLQINEEVVGKLFFEVTRNPHVFTVIEKSIDDDEYVEEEMSVTNKGEIKSLKISAMPIKDKKKQERHGVLIAIEDVTKLRKLETIRRDFVSNVTHELKTPLTSIKGFVGALKEGASKDPEVTKRFLDIIDIESDRLTMLIEDILSLSEIESMRMDKNTGMVRIAGVVVEVRDLLLSQAIDKDIELIIDVQEDLPEFKCNRDRIKQLFINLVDNSIKYTDEGSVRIKCYLSRDKEFIVIKVSDTGIGIEEEHLPRLFERFYRIDKGRSRKIGGTGLGLSIVKHIVELYQGTIDVKSVYGESTTFKIRLPLR